MPTRWSLWERTDERGTSVIPHVREGFGFDTSTLTDLALRSPSRATLVRQDVTKDYDTGWLGWPLREETEATWEQVNTEHWRFAFEGGPTMDCARDDDIGDLGDEFRTFALDCDDDDGVHTWWVPMRMDYPWGWGSHDTPGGWWYTP